MHEGAQFPGHVVDLGQEAREILPIGTGERGDIPEVSPGTDVGGYVVEARLGEGGFGTVFLARRGGQPYALKLLPLEEVGAWGVREMLTLARIEHPNVVRLLGHGRWPDQAPRYFVVIMEYVPGRRLDVWASTENPSAREVVRKVLGVARALEAIQRVKVVHRDVKEANILVRDDTGEVVLVDFGVGSDEEASWRTGGVLPPGTPAYRSPEAWRFGIENKGVPGAHYRPAHSDDLYALGVVLYWLLTNRKPFNVDGKKGVAAILDDSPKPPHLLNPRVPVELSELCLRLLAKKPEERHADAQDLCTALAALLERQEAAWEVPLCETFSEHTVTTRLGPGADEVAHYLKAAREAEANPRRGRLPVVVVDPPPPAPAVAQGAPISAMAECITADPPEAPAALSVEDASRALVSCVPVPAQAPPGSAHSEEQRGSPPAKKASMLGALGLTLALAVGVVLLWIGIPSRLYASPPPVSTETTGEPLTQASEIIWRTTWEVGRKVAYPWKPPEATPRDFFVTEGAGSSPASASRDKGEASVNDPQQKRQKRLGAVGKMIGTGITCATMACTGPQVRPMPPPEECPPGAVENMDKLGIELGTVAVGSFHLEPANASSIPVKEGWNSIRIIEWGRRVQAEPEAILSGKVIFGDRVYGRFTEARLPKRGITVRVCMELTDTLGKHVGVEREPSSTEGNVKVFSTVGAKAVDHFE